MQEPLRQPIGLEKKPRLGGTWEAAKSPCHSLVMPAVMAFTHPKASGAEYAGWRGGATCVVNFFLRNVQDSLQQRWQRFLDMTSRRHRRSLTVRMIWKKQKRNLQTMKVLQIASETTRRQVGKLMTSWSLFGKRMNRAVWWLTFVAEQLNHDEWFAALLATRI